MAGRKYIKREVCDSDEQLKCESIYSLYVIDHVLHTILMKLFEISK